MACLSIASGEGFFGEYQDVGDSVWSTYLAGLYYAFTTMTTVGYGDAETGVNSVFLFHFFWRVISPAGL